MVLVYLMVVRGSGVSDGGMVMVYLMVVHSYGVSDVTWFWCI